jgi:hypothetical protein
VEKLLKLGWDVLEERENPAFRVLVAERVEYEAFFGDEGVSVAWNPVRCGSRFNAPR